MAIADRLAAFPSLPVTDADHRRALDVQASLPARGHHRALSLVDALVAAIAEARALTVLHYDGDYELVASVTGQAHEWIVAPGTADEIAGPRRPRRPARDRRRRLLAWSTGTAPRRRATKHTVSARRIRTAAGGLVALAGATASFAVAAHTEASAVAVPAAAEAVVAFAPTHGCAGSPTVNVRVQAPVPDARAGAVDGWTATATPDGAGNTVLEWTGGLLPADEPGSFPVELLVPDVVGTLLAFPAVQRCASGEELAWIGTAPGDEYPAPQVLVLPAGSEPATTLEDVPADAPGRDLLVALLAEAAPDDDAGVAAGTTVAATVAATAVPPTAAPTSLAPDTTVVATTAVATTAPAGTVTTAVVTATSAAQDDGGGSAAGWIVGLVVAAVAIAAAGAAVVRRRGAGASGG